MSILVTGAGGMVGSHMVEIFHSMGEDVIGTYYKPTTDITEIDKKIRMIECDLRYPELLSEIIQTEQPKKIFHLAAQSYPTVSWLRPYETVDTNINGTVAVYEAVKKTREMNYKYDPIVVVACSSAEYGDSLMHTEGKPVKEDAPLLPLHPYGVSKVAQDLLSYQYYRNDNIRCIRARIFNSTGVRKVCDVTSDFTKRAVIAEKSGTYMLRVGNLNTRRAIMDQRDLIQALMLLAEKGTPGEAYNISSEKIYVMSEIIEMIEKEIGHKFRIEVDKSLFRLTDEPVIAGDVSKLRKDTGWQQEIEMSQTIHDMVEYWRYKL